MTTALEPYKQQAGDLDAEHREMVATRRNGAMKLTDNDMRVLQVMRNVLHPSRGGNGDFDGFMPHGSRDWLAIRRLLRDDYVEQLNEYATCQTCEEPHEDAAFTLTHWAFRLFAPEV